MGTNIRSKRRRERDNEFTDPRDSVLLGATFLRPRGLGRKIVVGVPATAMGPLDLANTQQSSARARGSHASAAARKGPAPGIHAMVTRSSTSNKSGLEIGTCGARAAEGMPTDWARATASRKTAPAIWTGRTARPNSARAIGTRIAASRKTASPTGSRITASRKTASPTQTRITAGPKAAPVTSTLAAASSKFGSPSGTRTGASRVPAPATRTRTTASPNSAPAPGTPATASPETAPALGTRSTASPEAAPAMRTRTAASPTTAPAPKTPAIVSRKTPPAIRTPILSSRKIAPAIRTRSTAGPNPVPPIGAHGITSSTTAPAPRARTPAVGARTLANRNIAPATQTKQRLDAAAGSPDGKDGTPPQKKKKLDAAAESPAGVDARKRKRQVIEAEDEGEPRGEERTEGKSIDVGLSGLALLTRDPRAADLLISMAASAVRCNDEVRKELLVPTIPPEFHTPNGMKDWNTLASMIDKLPALAKVPSACRLSEWLASIDGRLPCCLEWILGSFRGQLQEITLKPGFLDPRWTVYLVKPSSLEAVRAFEDRKRSAGGTFFAFHASPFFNWHSILRSNIKMLSGTKFAAHGAICGNGIYLASRASTILCYLRPGGTWRNSTFGPVCTCFALCEVVGHERVFEAKRLKAGVFVVSQEANVMLRCLCVCTRPMNEAPLFKASDMAALITDTDSYRTFFG
jgi:hypothetical protein